jgi:RHS repeat-associated protein
MAGQNTLYSQGFNFSSFVQDGVDPRTGQFTSSISLYETPAEIRNCASFKLVLKFSPSNTEDIGFGKGWLLNLSRYQHASPRSLLLSTGEHYQVVQDGGVLRVVDQKLQKFKLEKKGSDFQISYKDGRIEVLSNGDNVWNTSVPVGLYAPNGRRLTLTWIAVKGQPRLSKILEGSEELLQINYGDPYVEIVRAPGTAGATTFTAVQKSGRLGEFWLPLAGKPKWEFDYQTFGKTTCLTSIRNPIGLAETVTYKADGHKVPQGGPSAAVPYVVQHIADPGNGQPAIRTLYSYSINNFLGYGGVGSWKNGQDNLYNVRDDYLYTATVSVDGGQEITYTYNRFHLLTKTQQVRNKKQITQSIFYHDKENVAFEHQPLQFQLPRRVLTNYRDLTDQRLSRDEETQHAFDEWGNPIMDIQTSGVRTDRIYYPPNGEEGSCPADPHGFQRHLKQQTVTPAEKPDAAPVRIARHTYRGMLTAGDAPAASFVLVQKSQIFQDGRSISTIDRDYISRPDGRDHGRLQQKTTTLSENRATVQSWTHQYSGDGAVTVTVQQRGFDGCRIEDKTSYSLDQGLVAAHVDQSGVRTNFKYDQVGRLLSTTVSPGTSHEATQKNEYAITSKTAGYTRTVTDVKGVKARHTFDGLQRLCQIERQDDDGDWNSNGSYTGTFRVMQQMSYNSLGQCSQMVEVDWLRAANGPERQSTSHRYEYDDWGQVCKVTESNGVVTLTAVDPISQTHTEGVEGLGKKRIRVESEDVVVQAMLLKSDDTLYTSVDYANDGLGRRVRETDGCGNVTRFSYDCFDRVIETIWPNDSLAKTQYADHSVDPLPLSVRVQNTSTGEQSYDGLSRVTKKNSGGRTTLFSYKGSSPKPSSMTTPKKSEAVMVYDEALDYALKNKTMPDDQHSYNYNDRTGELMQSKNSYCTEDLTYLPSGLLKTEDIRIGQGKVLSTLHTYSMNGKLQQYSNAHGQRQELNYDDYGRLRQLSQGPLTVILDYDAASRLRRSSVKDSQKGSTLITELAYDGFSRERERTLIQDSKPLYKLIQDYDVLSRIKSRELKDGGGNSLRQECFDYDNMSRLIDYQCQGSQLPVDERGRQLQHQKYSFTTTGGIAEVTTNFQDGSKNVALYTYSNNDPSQLVRVTNSQDEPKEINLQYDANGCLTLDERGRQLEYNTLGCLTAVISPDGSSVLSRYHYDARGKLVCQEVPGKPDYHLYYREDSLIAASSGNAQLSYVSDGHFYWGQISQENGQTATSLWASDAHQSTIAWLNNNQPNQVHTQWYTPYGSCAGGSAICWNGQWRDPVTGWYHLGNGYRVYNPVLMRFHTPDSWSPFTSGEINAYAYCLGDPVNRVDPSGHSSVSNGNAKKRNLAQLIVGLVVSILAAIFTEGASLAVEIGVFVGTGVAADLATGLVFDAATGTTPTWESVGSDTLSSTIGNIVGLGVAKGVGKLFKAVGETLDQLLEGAAKIQRAGGARTLRPTDMELNQLRSEAKRLQRISRRSEAETTRLNAVEAQLKTIDSLPPWTWKANLSGSATQITKHETGYWSKYYQMRRLVSERRLHPNEAAKVYGDADYKRLQGGGSTYSFRLSQGNRVYFEMNESERLINVTQIGGHR